MSSTNYGSTNESAMRAFVFVSGHRIVQGRMASRSLLRGDIAKIAVGLMPHISCSRATANRLIRTAIDVLGFGESAP